MILFFFLIAYFEFLAILVLIWKLNKHRCRKPRLHLVLEFFDQRGERLVHVNLKVSEQVSFRVSAEDEYGNKTENFSVLPTFNIVDASLGKLVLDADGLGGVLKTVDGKLGETQLQALAEINGVQHEVTEPIIMIAGDAVKMKMEFGTPEDDPDHSPAV